MSLRHRRRPTAVPPAHRRQYRNPSFVERLEERRLLSAGELDRTFGDAGIAQAEFFPSSFDAASALAAGPGGSIYVGATAGYRFAVAKLNEDGELDPTFSGDGTLLVNRSDGTPLEGQVHGIAVQPDGKVVIAGVATVNLDFTLVRVNPDGTLDPTFGQGGIAIQNMVRSDDLEDLQLQADGKLLAIGSGHNGNRSMAVLARFLPSGSLDPEFGTGGRVVSDLGPMMGAGISAPSMFSSAVVLPDGKIVAAGYLAPGRAMLARYHANGLLDSAFADRGVAYDMRVPFNMATAITAAPGGGFYTTLNLTGGGIARWNADGTLDTAFAGGAGFVKFEANSARGEDGGSVVVQPDGNVLAAVDVGAGWALASLTPAGDQVFVTRKTFGSNEINASGLALRPDGRALVIGGGRTYPHEFPTGPVVARYRVTPDRAAGAHLEAGVIYVTGDAGNNVLNVSRGATDWTVTLDGATFTFPVAAASRVDGRLLGGDDDVTFTPGTPAGNFDLGGGNDVFRDGGVARRVLGGEGADAFELAAAAGVAPPPPGWPAATLVKGEGGDDHLLLLGTDAAESYHLTTKRVQGAARVVDHDMVERVNVLAAGGGDTFVLDVPNVQATLVTQVAMDGGEGDDTFAATSGSRSGSHAIVGGAGDDRVLLNPASGGVLTFAAGTGADRVTFTGTDAAESMALADSTVSMFGMSLALGDPDGLEVLEVNTAGGNDTLNVQRTRAAAAVTTINAGTGADTYAAGGAPLAASTGVTFNAGGDVGDAAVLADPGVDPHQYLVGGGTIRRDGVASLQHAGLDALTFTAGAGGSRITVADAAGLAGLTAIGGAGDDVIEVAPGVPASGLGSDADAKVRFEGGPDGADTFRVTPDPAATFQVLGGSGESLPVATGNDPLPQSGLYSTSDAGDRLELNLAAGAASPRLNWLARGRGRYVFAAPHRLVDFAGIEALNDLPAPAAPALGFSAGPPQTLTIVFAADVGASLTREDLVLTNLTSGQPVTPEDVALAYDAETRTAQFKFPGGPLAPGRYRAVLPAGSVAAVADGQPLAADFAIEFDPPLTAAFDPVSPDPAATPADAVTLRFSEPVTGFTRANLRLTRDGDSANLLTSAQPMTALPDGRSYTISNLAGLTAPPGAYRFTLVNTVFINDGSGLPLSGAAPVEFWVMTQPADATSGRFDFGTSSSALASGFSRVTPQTAYADAGYGWTATDPARQGRDRGTVAGATSLTRDFVETADGTFAARLADGTYDVTITMGDATAAHDRQGVYLEGMMREAVDTAPGQFVTRTYTVSVADGQLTLRLQDLGGSDGVCVINALAIAPTPWLAAGSAATWDAGTDTLVVTGVATITGAPGEPPLVSASGASAVLTIDPPAGGQVTLGGLQLSDGASAAVTAAGAARVLAIADGSKLTLDATSTLDLSDNALVVRNANASAASAKHASVSHLVRAAFNEFAWDGKGITSSTVKADIANGVPSSLGILLNNDGGGNALFYGPGTEQPTFMGAAVDANTVMVGFTRLGDGDLNGVVNSVDFALFQAGYTGAAPYVGFAFGDYDYNGVIDSVDFGLFQAGYQTGAGPASADEEKDRLAVVGSSLGN